LILRLILKKLNLFWIFKNIFRVISHVMQKCTFIYILLKDNYENY